MENGVAHILQQSNKNCETFRLDWRRSAASLKQWIIKKNPLNAHKKKKSVKRETNSNFSLDKI